MTAAKPSLQQRHASDRLCRYLQSRGATVTSTPQNRIVRFAAPTSKADALVADLRRAGFHVARIGSDTHLGPMGFEPRETWEVVAWIELGTRA